MYRVPPAIAFAIAFLTGSLPILHAQTVAPGRTIVRLLVGGAAPVAPSRFRSDWNPGLSTTASIGYAVSRQVELTIAAEFGLFGVSAASAPPPPPALSTSHGTTPVWAAWLDGGFTPRSGRMRPRAHVGAGVVAHGAARTAPALQVGVGLERSLELRLAAHLDVSLVHAFSDDPTDQAGIAEPLSYVPIRFGLSWR